jgi:CDP-diacylglycerol--glycerol-3-phosphate 3-phosphatidyltransferase
VLRSLAHSRGVSIPASPLGKFKMASQVVAILLLILASEGVPLFLTLGKIALWIAVFTAVASGVDYYRRFSHVLMGRELAAAASAVNRDEIADIHRVN